MFLIIVPIAIGLLVGASIFLVWHVGARGVLSAALNFFRKFIHPNWWLNDYPARALTLRLASRPALTQSVRAARLERAFSARRIACYKEWSLMAALGLSAFLILVWGWGQFGIMSILMVGVAWSWPELYVARRRVFVGRQAGRDLPGVIDLLRLYVSAGASVEQAVARLAGRAAGIWGEEFNGVLRRIEFGTPFEEALGALADRLALPELNRLFGAIKQSRVLGVSFSATLAIQGTLLRTRRHKFAEERARTAAVKIALPLVLCIFPALLIIYLAPAVLRVMSGL